MKLGNPHGPKPFTAEARQQGVEAQRQQADARAQQLSEILFEFAGQSANAVAKALNDRGLPSARGGKWTARSIINIGARLEDASGPSVGTPCTLRAASVKAFACTPATDAGVNRTLNYMTVCPIVDCVYRKRRLRSDGWTGDARRDQCATTPPCGLSPSRSSGIRTHARAVNAADTRMSGVSRLPNAC